ncbi:MAG: MoxR family ATPase [Dehalococcoidia bacterium]|nr:MoxR family ATPase [Dehalococcoidia bacterium]
MQAASLAESVIANVEKVIVGKRREVEMALLAVICQGHLLVEDVPGVGKTTLAKALARSLGCSFRRIQFTPDLLPSDVTGVTIYNQKSGEFEFRPGPILAQIVLADEINRATPRTQSALLEAMEERQITVDGTTYRMPEPFLVMATQNPIEYEGTFPLPEAQLDRFLMRISLGYPDRDHEMVVLDSHATAAPIDSLEQVIDTEGLLVLQREVKQVHVSDAVKEYIVDIVRATRVHPEVYLGASPRGSLGLRRTAQARALLQGRDYVTPDDIKALAEATLAHRVIISPAARIKNISARTVIGEVVDSVAVPGARVR